MWVVWLPQFTIALLLVLLIYFILFTQIILIYVKSLHCKIPGEHELKLGMLEIKEKNRRGGNVDFIFYTVYFFVVLFF